MDPLFKLIWSGGTQAGHYQWGLCSLHPQSEMTAASLLAERIAARRLPEPSFAIWHAVRNGRHRTTTDERARLLAYLDPDFGTPGVHRDDDRLEGAISEALWQMVVSSSSSATRSLIRIEAHGFSVTDPGGDGLVVWETSVGTLTFCLWEVKKHSGTGPVRDTVTGAHRQLEERALSYLARFSGVHQEISEPRLRAFYAKLVDLWQEGGEQVGAGVAVSASCAPDDLFDGLPARFPKLIPRLEGLLNAFQNYTAFCERVRDEIWKGL